MKKYIVFLLTALLLVACSNDEEAETTFKPGKPVAFELVTYEEKVAPIYMQQVPHIAYAINQEQFDLLRTKFDVENTEIDMDKNMAVFVVARTDSCGAIADGMYNNKNKLSVQLVTPTNDNCDPEPMNHTFVMQVEHGDYEKVELYIGNILKSSMDIKEKQS